MNLRPKAPECVYQNLMPIFSRVSIQRCLEKKATEISWWNLRGVNKDRTTGCLGAAGVRDEEGQCHWVRGVYIW